LCPASDCLTYMCASWVGIVHFRKPGARWTVNWIVSKIEGVTLLCWFADWNDADGVQRDALPPVLNKEVAE